MSKRLGGIHQLLYKRICFLSEWNEALCIALHREQKHRCHRLQLTDLIDENSSTFRLGNDTGQLTQSLTHQPGLQANVRITHLAFDLCTRYQSRYGVDNDDIDSAAAY